MSDKTKIEWSEATWNPVTGCDEVSPGCDHCYAKTFAERWRGTPGHHFEQGFDVVLRPERLDQPIRWTKPRRIFVNSMSDLFHKDVPDEFIARVFAVMALAPQHTFQLLTKRHARMRSLLNQHGFWTSVGIAAIDLRDVWLPQAGVSLDAHALPNVWLGVSVENQQWADIRIPALLDTPAAVRWLSCEPLLGPVNLGREGWLLDNIDHHEPEGPNGELRWMPEPGGIDWVVVGGESGRGARPMHPDWVRTLRDQCTTAGVPFFFKQWGQWRPWREEDERSAYSWLTRAGRLYPAGGRPEPDEPIAAGDYHTVDRDPYACVVSVGKKAAGRDLDGRTWDEYPRAQIGAAA